MPTTSNPFWLDAFVMWVGIIVFVINVVDWWIGKQGKARLRERVEDWWLRIEYVNWKTFGESEARLCESVFAAWFGQKLVSLQSVVGAAVTVAILAAVAWITVGVLESWNLDRMRFQWDNHKLLWPEPIVLTVGVWLSSAFTRLTLILPIRYFSKMKFRSAVYFLLVIIHFALFCFWPLIVFGMFAIVGGYALGIDLERLTRVLFSKALFDSYLTALSSGHLSLMILPLEMIKWTSDSLDLLIITYTSIAVPMVRLLTALVFSVSVVLRPIAKPIVSTMLLRFAESEKGVLSTVSLVLGAIAIAVQKIWKAFS